MANIQDGFNDFYNEFKEWTKEQILHRTYDICLENADKDRKIERLNNIYNELEKFCKDCIENHKIARENGNYTISDTFFELILDKLKEFKGEPNE